MPSTHRSSQVLLLALAVGCANVPAQTRAPAVSHPAEESIRAARQEWNAAFARRDSATLVSQWATDGILSTGAGTWRGREEILAEHYESLFRWRPDIVFIREPERIEGHKNWRLVSEQGTWVERWSESDGTIELRGTYFTMWREIGGKWLKLSEIFVPNSCTGGAYCAPRPPR